MLGRSVPSLLGIVPDDAFYYLTTARNIAAKNISSFDGLNPTNGYHPAWMALMVICAKTFSAPETLMRACLVTAALLHIATTFCLVSIFARWMARDWALIGGALWAINPVPVILALLGMEASCYVFALALTLRVYSSRIAPRLAAGDSPSNRDLVCFGTCLALCFLGRTEAGILAAVATLALLWPLRRGWLRPLFMVGGAFLAGVAPWFVYSYWTSGTLFQHSGAMKLFWAASFAPPWTAKRFVDALTYLFGSWMTYPVLGVPAGRWAGPRALAAILITSAVAWLLVRGLRRPDTRGKAALGAVLLAATMLTGSVYALFFSDTQYWYKAQPGFILFVVSYAAAVLALTARGKGPSPAAKWSLVLGAVAIMAVALAVRIRTLNPYPWQRDVFTSQRRFDELVPPGERIGCFNAGIPGYFSSRVIVNLDGLMNDTVYDYYRKGEIDRYLEEAKIRFIADDKETLERGLTFTRRRVSLEVVATAPLTDWGSGRRYLWRVSPARGP
jgi:hypothetical protein